MKAIRHYCYRNECVLNIVALKRISLNDKCNAHKLSLKSSVLQYLCEGKFSTSARHVTYKNCKYKKIFYAHLRKNIRYFGDLLLRELFSSIHVRILRAMKGSFQLFQLFAGEGGPASALLPLQRDARFAFRFRIVAAAAS